MTTTPLEFDPIDEARGRWDPGAGGAMAAATSIMRAQQLVLAAVDGALQPLGLTFARYEGLVLLTFSRTGALPLGTMGRRLMIHPTSVTNIVDRLESQGLVRRVPHPTDGRATLARVTPAGRRLAAEATEAVNRSLFGLGALGPGDLAHLTRIVRKLRVAAGDFAP